LVGHNAVTIALKQLREQPEPLPAELPGGLRTLIDRALVKDPAARLPDGSAFVAALDAAAAGRALPPPPAPSARPAPQPRAAATTAPRALATGPRPTGPVRVPPRRRTWARRSALVLVPLLALFIGAGAAALVLTGSNGGSRPAGAAAAVAADTGGGSGVTLVAADYVGRPVDEVAAQLTALGLTVQRQQDPTPSVPAGTVTRVDPLGVLLKAGDPVAISYAVSPGVAPSSSSSSRVVHTQAPVRSSAAEPTTTSPAAPTTEPEQTAASTPEDTSTATPSSSTATTTTRTTTPTTTSRSSATTTSSATTSSTSASSSTPSGEGGD
jgi:serine/threonine-protein kinase